MNSFQDCPPAPNDLLNGSVDNVTKHSEWNHTAVYQCNENFTLFPASDNERNCDSDGKWTGGLGECKPSKSSRISKKFLINNTLSRRTKHI